MNLIMALIAFLCLNDNLCIFRNKEPVFKYLASVTFGTTDVQLEGLVAPHHRLIRAVFTTIDSVSVFFEFRGPTLVLRDYREPTEILKDCLEHEIKEVVFFKDFESIYLNGDSGDGNIRVIDFINDAENKKIKDYMWKLGKSKEDLIFDDEYKIILNTECCTVTMTSSEYSREEDLKLAKEKVNAAIEKILDMRINFIEVSYGFKAMAVQ